MRPVLTLAAIGLLAASAPALAQEAGAPGASGVGPGMTGSNPPVGGMRPAWTYQYGPYAQGPVYYDEYSVGGPAPYGYDYGYYGPRPYTSGGLVEGRSAAEDAAHPVPWTVRGDQNGQDRADW
jgi:hypothetical protein